MHRKTVWMKLLFAVLFLLAFALVAVWGINSMHATIEANAALLSIDEEAQNPVTRFKTFRQQLRSMQKAQLNDIAHDAQSDPELAAMAQRQLILLCVREEDEMVLEGVLALRGWADCVVTVHDDSVNVILQTEMVTQQETSVILELVCRETGVQPGNVKIIPVN